MNLLEMVGYVKTLCGDVAEDDLAEGEVIQNLSFGSTRLANIIINSERDKMVTKTTGIVTVAAQADYVLPINVNDIFRVRVDGKEYSPLAIKEGGATRRLPTHRTSDRSRFFTESRGAAGRTQITLDPIPTANGLAIDVWYVLRPEPFHIEYGIHYGVVTTPATTTLTTTRIVASAVPFAGSVTNVGLDHFWDQAEIRWTDGKNQGITVRVNDFDAILAPNDYGVLTLRTDDALPNVPTVGEKFELCQVSVLPPQHHELVCMWAAGLSASKAGADAKMFFEIFEAGVAGIRSKITDNVEKAMPGQTGSGAR